MEAQITEDNEIVFRVFSYGYGYADVNKEIHTTEFDNKPVYTLHFPERAALLRQTHDRVAF